jgi:hypothetical protein
MALISDSGTGLNLLGGGNDASGGLGGGLLLGLLLGRSNLLGGNVPEAVGAATISTLNASTLDNIQTVLGDIKASVPYNEAQVQLAISNALAQLTNQNNANTHTIQAGQTAAALAASTNAALLARDIAAVESEIAREASETRAAVVADGAATRALITSNTIADLNAKLVISANEAAELRESSARAADTHGISINMINNQNQNQLQFQQQRQAINSLVGMMHQQISNQAINIGSGRQTANPNNTNVNA